MKIATFNYLNILIVVIVLVGCGLNDLNDKFTRFKSEMCRSGVLTMNMENSEFCCDDSINNSVWVCLAAYDFFNQHMTSMKAFYLPIIPLMLTISLDFLIHMYNFGFKELHLYSNLFVNCLDRLKWIVMIIIYRTVKIISRNYYNLYIFKCLNYPYLICSIYYTEGLGL